MSYEYSEDVLVESVAAELLEKLGWQIETAWQKESFGKDGLLGREDKSIVILSRFLLTSLKNLNPDLPEIAYNKAIDLIKQKTADSTIGKINRDKYDYLKNGVPVTYTDNKGKLLNRRLKVFDFKDAQQNHFLAIRQLEVHGELYHRRPDIIGFVNGIPLLFMECKAPGVDIEYAYTDNLTDYKDAIPHLFYTNAFIILTNGTDTKIGSVTSPYKFFHEWKRIEEEQEGIVSLETMLNGVCDKERFMDIFENFILFDDSSGTIAKIVAKNHQYLGVNKVIDQIHNIKTLNKKLGVFWHTQGSGKSYSMVFLCEKIHRTIGGAYTFLLVVDRSELESQLYDTFSGVGVVNDKNLKAKSRKHLQEILGQNHKYIFTLIHKFSIDPKKEFEYPLITERENIVVISDEAHRTQGGTFARNMRYYAIPNASYLGFTGTPIIKEEEEITRDIFGDYVSVYDFKKAIQDGATLPLKYINRGEKLNIDNPKIDEEMAKIIQNEDLDEDSREKLARLFKRDYPILTAPKRLNAIAKDLVWHFNERGYQGKAMFIALDKPTAVKMYDYAKEHWQAYTEELKQKIKDAADEEEQLTLERKLKRVEETEICVVVSPEQNEIKKFKNLNLDIKPHREKMANRNLEVEFKDENNPFRLVIVCSMWITGFDVPCVSTIYMDKPIQGHTLMQTIARANRVYDDEKENGLIVDYGNVYKQLEKAYMIYGEGDKEKKKKEEKPIEELQALEEELKESINEVINYLKQLGFKIEELIQADSIHKLAFLKTAIDCISLNESTRATFEALAKDVFRKYKALFPEEEAKKYTKTYNAIEAIYNQLNKKIREADISEYILELQDKVNKNVTIKARSKKHKEVVVNLSDMDTELLKILFAKQKQKNKLVYDLQQAIGKKVGNLFKKNPNRLEFYQKYKKIIEEYNKGKDQSAISDAFQKLKDFLASLQEEEERAMKEGLDEETLAIYDILKKEKLKKEEINKVKKVALTLLQTLKEEKLKIERWRESEQITAQIKTTILDNLYHLPERPYPEKDVEEKAKLVFLHIHSNYYGGGKSVYSEVA